MKPATFAPAYCAFYPMLAEICRENGYALAIHGTVSRDFDLIAIPWTTDPVSADTLITLVLNFTSMFDKDKGRALHGPENKEHGRIAWSISVGNGSVIDFSVMPLSDNL
jgi:hypothetical protein